MALPNTVNVIGRQYTICYDKSLEELLGQCNPDTLAIIIKPGQQLAIEVDTVLHEVVHAIDIGMQLSMSERQVYCITAGLIAVLKSNPQFLDYLNEALT